MILDRVRAACARYQLVENGDAVVVACSGGADSMALLQALFELQTELGVTVCAAHFHHGIRGAEADRDAKFVQDFCAQKGIRCVVGYGDVPTFAETNHLSSETAARQLRYDFLQQTANGAKIATAHHADDHLETVLFHLARGTALDGLCGIPPKRGNIIRPLYLCTRQETEAFCRSRGIDFVTDSTNAEDAALRNRLRHQVLPALYAAFPAAAGASVRMADSLRDDRAALEEAATAVYRKSLRPDETFAVDQLLRPPKAIAVRVLRRALEERGMPVDSEHLNRLYDCCKSGGKCSLPGGISAKVQNGALSFGSEAVLPVRFSVFYEKKPFDRNVYKKLFTNLIDCDKIEGSLKLKTRSPGDTFCLRRSGGTKSLKKLLNEFQIPIEERENLPMLCDDRGIVWIAKIGVCARCRVGENTVQVVEVAFSTIEEE